ncbi:MAG TPA: transcriptional regulator [Candidatus Binatia bacterium]|nr:transcriptional regulator [Candidatus Binatia bacterium]
MNEEIRSLIDIDRTIHEPARLMIVAVLSAVAEADFLYLLNATALTKGNLSAHLSRLEEAGYVAIEKTFVGKTPRTVARLTAAGAAALEDYRKQLRSVVDGDIM